MIVTYKHLFAIAAVCVSFLALALAIKAANTKQADLPPRLGSDQISIERPQMDPLFYKLEEDKPKAPAKAISAKAYLVGDIETGEVLMEQNSSSRLPVASMSKLVTAMAATYLFSATTSVEITENSLSVPPDSSKLQAGEKFTVNELLYPMLLNSSNVAAEALASTTNRAQFLELMSSYAWEVGMPSTYFADPSGVDPKNASSARDIFSLAKYLYEYRPDILGITRTPKLESATTTEHGSHEFASIHPFVNDPEFIGGKTGRTPEAGDTMLTIMRINDRPIAFVVLGSGYDMRASDTRKLIERYKQKLAE